MVQDIFSGLQTILSFESLLAILLGVLYGMIVGAVPGLSVSMGTALVVPFTYYMSPSVAIPFLLGIYKGGVYGGSIPAILISTPGAGGSIATMLDGYPLSRQGRSKTAIQMSLYASFLGDLLGSIFTILVAARVAKLATAIGRPDFFAILFFSLFIISVATSENAVKGLVSGALGLLLSTIGTDVGGRSRFTFGNARLMSGLSFIPLIIGLFAFSVIMEHIVAGRRGEKEERERREQMAKFTKNDRLHWHELRKTMPTMLRSTCLGAFIGIVPGIGQPIASLLGYSVGKKLSKEPEKYGKGSLDGLAACEAANNAVNGPALIPLLGFGIPGDTGTAIILGALTAQGLRPGMAMFRDEASVTYGILLSMVVACIFLLIAGYFLSGVFAKISYVPMKILIPVIFALAVSGSFAVSNSLLDVFIMIAFGVLGFLMKKFKFPRAPLAICFLLGHDIEYSLTQSMILFDGNILKFTSYPIATAFICLTFVLLIAPFVIKVIKNRKQKKQNADSEAK